MKSVILLLIVIGVAVADPSSQAFCASEPVTDNSYWCSNDNSGYYFCLTGAFAPQSSFNSCPSGTTCACAHGSACPSDFGNPCRTAQTLSPAQQFCNSVGAITSPQGYYCSNDGTGFYQCLSDSAFSSQDAFQSCPTGTVCSCSFGVDCSYAGSAVQHSPCTFPPADSCSEHPFNCFSGNGITPCSHSCSDMGSYCFAHSDTSDGKCGNNAYCFELAGCNHDSDCGAGHFCSPNTCCGSNVCMQSC